MVKVRTLGMWACGTTTMPPISRVRGMRHVLGIGMVDNTSAKAHGMAARVALALPASAAGQGPIA